LFSHGPAAQTKTTPVRPATAPPKRLAVASAQTPGARALLIKSAPAAKPGFPAGRPIQESGEPASALTGRACACVCVAGPITAASPSNVSLASPLPYRPAGTSSPARNRSCRPHLSCLVFVITMRIHCFRARFLCGLWRLHVNFSVLQVGAYRCVFLSLYAGFHVCVWRWVPLFSV